MIRKFDVDDIVKILKVDDEIEKHFPCDKGQWNQWLMSEADNPNFLIAGEVDGDIKSYIVVRNGVEPPVSYSVSIGMFYSSGDFDKNIELRDFVNDWARGKGAREVLFQVKDEKELRARHRYGAEQKGIVGGWSV